MNYKDFSQDELREVLMLHKKWLNAESNGVRADLVFANLYEANLRGANLYGANLRGANLYEANLYEANLYGANLYGANLRGANLYGANLRGANLYEANLYGANFRGADLYGADLYGADLYGADLRGANLRGANFRGANLYGANFRGADLYGADLYGADLYGADLRGANLRGANLRGAKNIPFVPMSCPEVGAYVAFKKANKHIVVLEIPEDALRSSATTRKCRASKARVLRIENLDGSISDIQEVQSNYDLTFIYKVGETVEVEDFDMDRWNECSTGIHHFMSRQEAVDYSNY